MARACHDRLDRVDAVITNEGERERKQVLAPSLPVHTHCTHNSHANYMHAAAGLILHEDAPSGDDGQAINSVTGA
eukprot:2897-Heterococcus_DN1.PRE.1